MSPTEPPGASQKASGNHPSTASVLLSLPVRARVDFLHRKTRRGKPIAVRGLDGASARLEAVPTVTKP